ncbi:Sjogren's syndrome/scleroderma autoantigen 1 family protein [Halocatena marina]|uniref:Sjogren's syndrome/scleroderma autoantigen 1 family protein n=1 Tax=Halocatena marina TaxID=2934937 RepID=UPI00200DB9F3|nr:Sjogren's syndrome/scleroderma autoantigen 1 family protein [Halocatena marina]
MSDFDKEAEREKLRKQFEEDEKKRKSTERMSELLLQGATMTNKHCDVCGNPLFRQQGQEFCPTCQTQGTDVREQPPAEQQQPDETTQAESTTSIEIEEQTANTSETTPAEPIDENNISDPSSQSRTPQTPSPSPSPESHRTASPSESASSTRTTDLTEARRSLVRTVTNFAKQAEAADELSRAQMLLTATKDAAEALEAVNRAEE